jgi:hypothetical protein
MPLRAEKRSSFVQLEDKIFPWAFAGIVVLILIADFILVWILFGNDAVACGAPRPYPLHDK